jgi:hypothetical protein
MKLSRAIPALLVAALAGATAPLVFADDPPKAEPAGEPAPAPPEKPADKPAEKPADKPQEPAAPPPDNVDTDSPQAKSLEKKLHVAPNWRPQSYRVDLSYKFANPLELQDWKFQGADRAEFAGPGRKEPAPLSGLEVTVSSGSTALGLLDPVEFNGDFTIELTAKLTFFAPSSDLVFVVGAKGSDAVGLRFGDQFVKVKKGSVSALSPGLQGPDRWSMNKHVDLKLVRKGDELQVFINKAEGPKRKFARKELDGKVGVLLSANARLKISRFRIEGGIVKP